MSKYLEDLQMENYGKLKHCDECPKRINLIDKHWKKNHELQNTIIEWQLHSKNLQMEICQLKDKLHSFELLLRASNSK